MVPTPSTEQDLTVNADNQYIRVTARRTHRAAYDSAIASKLHKPVDPSLFVKVRPAQCRQPSGALSIGWRKCRSPSKKSPKRSKDSAVYEDQQPRICKFSARPTANGRAVEVNAPNATNLLGHSIIRDNSHPELDVRSGVCIRTAHGILNLLHGTAYVSLPYTRYDWRFDGSSEPVALFGQSEWMGALSQLACASVRCRFQRRGELEIALLVYDPALRACTKLPSLDHATVVITNMGIGPKDERQTTWVLIWKTSHLSGPCCIKEVLRRHFDGNAMNHDHWHVENVWNIPFHCQALNWRSTSSHQNSVGSHLPSL